MVLRINLLLLLVSFGQFSYAQVSTNPALPVEGVPVTITFDATQGIAGLKDYTGDVYVHTGVITDKSSSSIDWKYTIGSWGDNTLQPKLTRISGNIYSFQIAPNIRNFYGVPATEKILKMAFVFRSGVKVGSEYLQGKATGGNDILIDVYSTGLNAAITNPVSNSILQLNTNLQLTASATVSSDIRLFLNNSLVNRITGTQISFTNNFSLSGDYWIKVTATDGTTTATDSVFVTVLADQANQPLPAGSKKGINYIDSQTARLVLWAPYKSYVYAIGEFSNWSPSSKYRMKKDGDYYWLDISNLIPGKEYPFQYLVDGQLKIADPYTEKISDPVNDSGITNITYPGLIQYPTGKTVGITSILQTNQQPYVWQSGNYTTPSPDTMVVYECLVRDFDALHSYSGVISHLDYLKTLGVNVLELMPVNEFEGNSSWGYNPSFYFAPDKYYGPKNDLKRLVDECHKRGIATVLDLVLNHSFGQSPFVQLYFDGTYPTSQNPWYNIHSNFTNPDAQWGYDFNHESPYTKQLVDSINSFWMSEYKIDGFRFDFTKGFSNNIKDSSDPWGSKYDSQRIANLERMASEIWKRKPGAMVIFEHFADNSEESVLANYGKGILLWGNLNVNATEAAMGYNDNNNSDLSSASYLNRGWSKPSLVGYMESHDEERMVYKCITYGNASGSYDIKSLPTALNRAALTAALFIPLPGPKMIWQFEELGYDVSINYIGRTDPKPIHWEYKSNADRDSLYHVFSKLLNLKKKYPIFSTTDVSQSLNSDIKWIKLNLNGDYVLIAGNFGIVSANPILEFQKTGTWYDFFGKKSLNVATTSQSILLAPGEYKLYSTQNWGGIITGVNELRSQNELQIIPNPATDYIRVYSVNGMEHIAIFTITGIKEKEFQFSGNQNTDNELYIGDLHSGIYLIQARSINGQTFVRKIIKRP